jgi:hypothetical protein
VGDVVAEGLQASRNVVPDGAIGGVRSASRSGCTVRWVNGATPNGVQLRDLVILRAAAGRERMTVLGSLVEWLATGLPLGGTDDIAIEVRREGRMIARRTFRKPRTAEEAKSRFAARVEAMTKEEFESVQDWQAEIDQV